MMSEMTLAANMSSTAAPLGSVPAGLASSIGLSGVSDLDSLMRLTGADPATLEEAMRLGEQLRRQPRQRVRYERPKNADKILKLAERLRRYQSQLSSNIVPVRFAMRDMAAFLMYLDQRGGFSRAEGPLRKRLKHMADIVDSQQEQIRHLGLEINVLMQGLAPVAIIETYNPLDGRSLGAVSLEDGAPVGTTAEVGGESSPTETSTEMGLETEGASSQNPAEIQSSGTQTGANNDDNPLSLDNILAKWADVDDDKMSEILKKQGQMLQAYSQKMANDFKLIKLLVTLEDKLSSMQMTASSPQMQKVLTLLQGLIELITQALSNSENSLGVMGEGITQSLSAVEGGNTDINQDTGMDMAAEVTEELKDNPVEKQINKMLKTIEKLENGEAQEGSDEEASLESGAAA